MNNWITPYVKQYKARIAYTIIFALLGVASGALLLFVSGYLISKSSLRPENILMVYVPVVAVRAFSIGQAVFPYFDKLVSHDIVLRILAKYRQRLYNIIEPQAIFLQSRFQTGDILSVLSDDIEKLQDFYIKTLLPSIIGIVVYGVFAIVIGFFDWMFMLMMLLLLGVIIFLMPTISYYVMKKNHLFIKRQRNTLYQRITDAMFGQLDWLVSGRVTEVARQVENENELLLQKEKIVYRWHHMRDAFLRIIVGISIVTMIVWTNKVAGEELITTTLIAAFVLMMFSITDALLPVNDAVEEIPTYVDSLKRMEEIEGKSFIEQVDISTEEINWNSALLTINKINYKYEKADTNTLHNLSMRIEPSKKIAILGKSGTGKSTLLKLIAGVIDPDEGEILLDDIQMNQAYLAKAVSVLNQKPHLFHTTIANNVRIGKPDATDEEITDALKRAQLFKMIEELPKGIHTQMDEMGKRFSGGERQRIAFARVLIQNTPIIVMDEPTTGLDPRTERELLNTMLEAAKDKTVIWVTHHLAGAELMDEVIFLDEGNIKMQGSHFELIKTNEYYRSLYEMDEGM